MYVIVAQAIGQATLLDSNLDFGYDAPAYNPASSYSEDDVVYQGITTYQCIAATTPGIEVTNTSYWIETGTINRFKAFNDTIEDYAEAQSGDAYIYYEINVGRPATAIGFAGLRADEITVEVWDDSSPAVKVFEETKWLIEDVSGGSWYGWFTGDSRFKVKYEAVIDGFRAEEGYTVRVYIGDPDGIAVSGSGPRVGQIKLGKRFTIGDALEETELGLTSYSTKETNDFGRTIVVPRAKADPVTFRVAADADTVPYVKRALNSLRDTPTIYYATADLVESRSAFCFGFFQDYRLALRQNGKTIYDLELDALT